VAVSLGDRCLTTFAATFRELVTPDLARMCRARGVFIALGMNGWGESFDEVMTEALHRGAIHLPAVVFEQLEEWVATSLLRAITAADTEQYAAMPDREVWGIILERPWSTTTTP
jgi:hypothetical protein